MRRSRIALNRREAVIRAMTRKFDPLLPFPRRVVIADESGRALSEEYDIPVNSKEKVLRKMYLFQDCPALDDVLCDLHAGKRFTVVDFKVVRESAMNLLVSPYYYESGGTVIDWVPADWADEGTD
jgi:hypothetical protein